MELTIKTTKKQECIDLKDKIEEMVKKSKVKKGICFLYNKHTTSALIINENYDPNICDDILKALSDIIPNGNWKHNKVDNNAAAHIKSCLLGNSCFIPIKEGKLQLGRWQSPMYIELDGPRERTIIINIISS